MNIEVISLKCPNCNSGVDTSMKECPACDKPIIIRQASQTSAMPMPLVNKYLGTYRALDNQCPNNKEINTPGIIHKPITGPAKKFAILVYTEIRLK
mgnify:CR=1 FL=1